MFRARSLLTGKLVNANSTSPNRAAYLKTACPECLEPVHLMCKNNKQYFAHYPLKETTPYCLWRIIRNSGSITYSQRPLPIVRPMLKPGIFQRALQITFGVASLPPLNSTYHKIVNKLIRRMQLIWSVRGQCISESELFLPHHEYSRKWTSAGKLYQAYDAIRLKNFPYLTKMFKLPRNKQKAEKVKKERSTVVLLLWSQLHRPQFRSDLYYLFQLSYHMYKNNIPKVSQTVVSKPVFAMVSGYLIYNAMNLLAAVPWLEMT
jgi:hypothetical protein